MEQINLNPWLWWVRCKMWNTAIQRSTDCLWGIQTITVLHGSQTTACILCLSTLSPWSTVTQSKNFPLASFRNPIFPLHPVQVSVINCASLLSNGTLIVFFFPVHHRRQEVGGWGWEGRRSAYYMIWLPLDKPQCRDAPEDWAPVQGGEQQRLSLNHHPLQESRNTYMLRRCDTEVSNCGKELITFCSPASEVDTVQIYHFLVKGLCRNPSWTLTKPHQPSLLPPSVAFFFQSLLRNSVSSKTLKYCTAVLATLLTCLCSVKLDRLSSPLRKKKKAQDGASWGLNCRVDICR